MPIPYLYIAPLQPRLGDQDVAVSNTHQVFAGGRIGKGKLVIMPLGFVQVVHVDKLLKTSCSIKAPDMKDHCFIITPWRVDFVKRTGAFIPYWMVKEGTSADECCLSRTSIKAGKYSIPAYVNKRLIEEGTPLLVEPAEEKESAPKKRKVGAKWPCIDTLGTTAC